MKKLLSILLLAVTISTVAQDKFTEGVITMTQSMSSPNEQVKAQLDMMGDMITTTYVDGKKSRTESSSHMTGDITVIIDSESNELLQLMDIPGMGKKYTAQNMEITEEMMKNITVEEGAETKEILGYHSSNMLQQLNNKEQK